MKCTYGLAVVTLGASLALLPQTAIAQSTNDWQFHAVIYGYFPDIKGTSDFSTSGGTPSINIDSSKIINELKFAFMGTFEAQKGRWGFLSDVMYLDVGSSSSGTRDISIGHVELPVGATANVNLDIKGTVWTVAGSYRLSPDPKAPVDVFAGARLIDLKETLGWEFSADLGPNQPSRSGNSTSKANNWDGIVGFKGRLAFGPNREWYVPYYADVGTGDSDLTWQVFAGLGYSFRWGDIVAGWRHLDYNFKSSAKLQDASFNGPLVGVGFHW